MSVHWLIEVDAFPETAQRIVDALERRGQPWTCHDDNTRPSQLPPAETPLLFWGSLGAAYSERAAQAWRPGAIGDIARFACSRYFEGLAGIPLANADSVFTTVAELVAAPSSVVALLGQHERVFVRPDSPLKPFSGRVLALGEISLATLDHGFYYDDEHLPIVVSTTKHVTREWRFVVGDGAVIAGCEYQQSRQGAGTDIPAAARELAGAVAAAPWQAAALYVVDVGEVDGQHRVMELNPFSGADLYHCDPDAVVEAASRIAQRLFEELSSGSAEPVRR